MKDVKVTELRQNLPTYLAKVARGERIRVSSRGKIIAEIAPPSGREGQAARDRLRGSVKKFVRPLDPVLQPEEWDMNR